MNSKPPESSVNRVESTEMDKGLPETGTSHTDGEGFDENFEIQTSKFKALDVNEQTDGTSSSDLHHKELPKAHENVRAVSEHDNAKAEELDGAATELKKKKKKRSGKSKSKRASEKPTGFEEYYVDPPVTPEEFQEEQSLYDPTKPFTDRIQIAVSRFSSRRTFSPMRSLVFDKYMAYGGFLAGNKMFQGSVDTKSQDLTSQEISELKNKYYVKEDILSTSTVDFEQVLQGFL